jgi:hypothetical protein
MVTPRIVLAIVVLAVLAGTRGGNALPQQQVRKYLVHCLRRRQREDRMPKLSIRQHRLHDVPVRRSFCENPIPLKSSS